MNSLFSISKGKSRRKTGLINIERSSAVPDHRPPVCLQINVCLYNDRVCNHINKLFLNQDKYSI